MLKKLLIHSFLTTFHKEQPIIIDIQLINNTTNPKGVCMNKVKQMLSFIVLTALMFSYQSTFAQGLTTAALNGHISDAKGEALPGANIIAVHEPSGTQYGTTSREDGRYNLLGLRVGGPYKVTVSFVGYTPQVEEGFILQLGQNLRIDFKLPEQAVELTGVTITAEKGAILSQARTGAATNVSSRTIESLPTTSRSFSSIAKLSPLVSGTDLSMAGRRSKLNNIQLDGAQFNDLFGLGESGTPGGQANTNPISLDAISEYQIVIAPYDVRHGGFTGGGINAITKSGTNRFNASAYFYGKNQNLVGQYEKYDGTKVSKYDEFTDYQYGVSVGGPVIKDKLFFFINAELTQYDSPTPSVLLQNGTGNLSPSQITTLANQISAALAAKGFTTGGYDNIILEQPSTKLFLRFDYNLADNHKLTLRHNYVDASAEKYYNSPRGATNFVFNTQPYAFFTTTNSTVLQLSSTFSNTMSNELIVGYTTIRDKRHGKSSNAPEVLIKEQGVNFYSGPERFSSHNQLDQDIIEISDNFSFFYGDHTFTIGTHNEFYKVMNLYGVAGYGAYEYNSFADFQANKVSYYQRQYRNFLRTPGDPNDIPAAEFDVAQFGFYIQDEWTISPTLKLTAGIRADIPTFANPPDANPFVPQYFPGYQTDAIPSGNILWSPRIGFNWDVSGDRTTQIRGGLGIFSGRVPYVQMSNNYGNTGTFIAEVRSASSGVILPFIADPLNQYIAGDPRVTNNALGTPRTQSDVNMASPDTKMPQLLRFNVGVDKSLLWDFIGTVEFQFSKTMNDILYRKINLKAPIGIIPVLGSGMDGRIVYGGSNNGGGNFLDVLEMYNTSSGYQYNLVFQVQRNVASGFSVNAGYAYGQAFDRNSLASSRATSMMNYNPIDNDPNNPALTHSSYEIEHRTFASISYTQEFFENAPTTISLFYNGQSGQPFSFVVDGDLNGDGWRSNDLFYIPRNSSEILLGTVSGGQYVPASQKAYDDLTAFINNNEYLSDNRGKISERNGGRDPWQSYLDLSIRQDIPDLWGMGRFQVSLDISNVLNLLNSSWGINESSGLGTFAVVKLENKITYNGKANTPVYSFTKKANNSAYSISDSSSRWRMMFGIRYSL